MNLGAFDVQRMTPRTRWAAGCFILTFIIKFIALIVGFAGMKSMALVLFGLAFISIFTAVGLCISDMLSQRDGPMKHSEWGPDVPGMMQVSPGLYVPMDR